MHPLRAFSVALFNLLLAMVSLGLSLRAQQLDPDFAPTLVRSPGGTVSAAMELPDGRILATGDFSFAGSSSRNGIARLQANGAVDPTFNPGLGADDMVHFLHRLPDGRLLIGGAFTTFDGVARRFVARLEAGGALDATYNANAALTNDTRIRVLHAYPDGRLLLFSNSANSLCRLLPDGTMDEAFGLQSVSGEVWHATSLSDGSTVVVGAFTTIGGHNRRGVARLTPTGAIDETFGQPESALVGNNGDFRRVVAISGDRLVLSRATAPHLIRLLADGSHDTAFVPGPFTGGNGFNGLIADLIPAGDDRVIALGSFLTIGGAGVNGAVRINADGSLDSGFSFTGASDMYQTGIRMLANGGVLTYGLDLGATGSLDYRPLRRYTASGVDDSSLQSSLGTAALVSSVIPQSGGRMVVLGDFSHVNGTARPGIVRLLADGSLDPNYEAVLSAGSSRMSSATGLPGDGVLINTNRATVNLNGQSVRGLVALAPDGTFAPDVVYPAVDGFLSAVWPDGSVATARSTAVDGQNEYQIQRFLPDGSIDTAFNAPAITTASGYMNVSQIVPQADGSLWVCGHFDRVGDDVRVNLARLTPTGKLDPMFNAGLAPNTEIRGFWVQRDGKPLLSGHLYVEGMPGYAIFVRFLADGSHDPAYNFIQPTGISTRAGALLPDDRLLISRTGDWNNPSKLERYLTNGSLDPDFNPPPLPWGGINSNLRLLLRDDGSIVLFGQRHLLTSPRRYGIARLQPSPGTPSVEGFANQIALIGATLTLDATASGTTPITYRWFKEGAELPQSTGPTLTISQPSTADVGRYTVVTSNAAGATEHQASVALVAPTATNATDAGLESSLTFTTPDATVTHVTSSAPWLQIVSGTSLTGSGTVTYRVAPNSTRAARSTALTVGDRIVVISQDPDSGRLVNLSTRGITGQGSKVMISGVVLSGKGSLPLLIRGSGPALERFGVPGLLSDPKLDLYRKGTPTPLHTNDDWTTVANPADLIAASERVGAFALPAGSTDAALLVSLPAGAYTAHFSGKSESGVGLIEFYDAGSGLLEEPRLVNLSTRAEVAGGAQVLIVGFHVWGANPKRLLIRSVGPALESFGVAEFLPDPMINVYAEGADEPIATNDNWNDSNGLAAVMARAGAFGLPVGGKDAALIISLEPGLYTVHISSVGGATGVALAEIYYLEE